MATITSVNRISPIKCRVYYGGTLTFNITTEQVALYYSTLSITNGSRGTNYSGGNYIVLASGTTASGTYIDLQLQSDVTLAAGYYAVASATAILVSKTTTLTLLAVGIPTLTKVVRSPGGYVDCSVTQPTSKTDILGYVLTATTTIGSNTTSITITKTTMSTQTTINFSSSQIVDTTSYNFTITPYYSLDTLNRGTSSISYFYPGNPKSVTITPGAKQLTVNWIAPDGIDTGISYAADIYTLTPSAYITTTTTTALSTTFGNLANSTTYRIGIYARNSKSDFVGKVYVNGTTHSVPAAPSSVSATSGENQTSTIGWSLPTSDGGSAILSYTVSVASPTNTGIAPQTVSGATANSKVFLGLTNGTTYTFSVVATNAAGSSIASVASPSATPATPPPPMITADQAIAPSPAAAGTTLVTVTVTNKPTNDTTISYKLYQKTPTSSEFVEYTTPFVTNGDGASTGTFMLNIASLTPGQNHIYTYQVEGFKNETSFGKSNDASIVIACLPRGTKVLTPAGYRLVEDFANGDLVTTDDGREVPVKVNRSSTSCSDAKSAPVRIAAKSFFGEYPVAPIRVSSWHAFKVGSGNQWLLPKDVLGVEGVVQEPFGQAVEYYHFELPDYLRDNLVLEGGAAVESYGIPWKTAAGLLGKAATYIMDKEAGYCRRITGV